MRRNLSILLFLILLLSFIRIYKISENSMNYSLIAGDIVIVDNFSVGIHIPSFFFYIDKHIYSNEKGIHRGDLLAFRHPLDKRLYIKRCIALPKDTLFEHNKNLYLQIESNSTATLYFAIKNALKTIKRDDGYWLVNPYRKYYDIVHDSRVYAPRELIDYPKTTLAPHEYFMMGDFRDNSTDSRFFGAVNYDYIYYKVRYIIKKSYSLKNLSKLKEF